MTRGNQREIDRQRALNRKKKAGGKSDKEDGLTPQQRKERDAAALKLKVEQKQQQQQQK